MLISKVLIVLTLLSPSFFHIGTDDGLSQLSVLSMAEDAEGAIWVGTSDGLNRIEGKTITVYRHSYQKDDTILDDEVSCLSEDADGGIIACGRYGISIFDRTANRFKSIKTDFPVQCCADIRRITKCPDGDSNYLVYSYNRMLLASNPFRGTTDTISCNFSATALCVCDSVLYVGTNKGLVYQLRCGRNTLENRKSRPFYTYGRDFSIRSGGIRVPPETAVHSLVPRLYRHI